MGSTGSGSFSDYNDYKKTKSSNDSGEQNSNGGSSGEDLCARAFSANLDEVSKCEYFKTNKNVPDKGTFVKIDFNVRLLVLTEDDICIGYLPTKYNYLRACMADGFSYSGIVNETSIKPIPSILVDIVPENE